MRKVIEWLEEPITSEFLRRDAVCLVLGFVIGALLL